MPLEKPQLSVVFPIYRRWDEAQSTLEILRRIIGVRYEAIALDNSPERRSLRLESHERQIFTGANLGAAARNIGNSEAEAPFILQLDDDSHPLPGAVESGIERLSKAPQNVAGISARILRPDGSAESTPLLPTAFHGCGALFRKSSIEAIGDIYPGDFLFYGEEYWTALLLHSRGMRLEWLPSFHVCHRFSPEGRSKDTILYRITLNNRRTWPPFAPGEKLDTIMADTLRRYELVSMKEGVEDSFRRAMSERLDIPQGTMTLSQEDFAAFSMLDRFDSMIEGGRIRRGEPCILCGCGKFPSLWAQRLERGGASEVILADLNTGIAGRDFLGRKVLAPDAAVNLALKGVRTIVGHCSRGDGETWLSLLSGAKAPQPLDLNSQGKA